MVTLLCCILFTLITNTLADDQLILLQAVWRHGDRSPTGTCKGDPNKEDKWPLGWGQLTPLGMQQHIKLGNIIYDRYVSKLNFLSSQYSPWEFYVRSTDNNRTIQSAMANFIGFYYKRTDLSKVEGIDYPKNPAWPIGYIPVPVHSYNYNTDYVGEPDLPCPRQNWLWSEVRKTPEYQELLNKSQPILEELSKICQEKIDLRGAWTPYDAFFCEKQHNMTPPVTDSFFSELQQMEWTIEGFEDGIGLKPFDGFDFKIELAKLRGGTILWDIISHADFKRSSMVEQCQLKIDGTSRLACYYLELQKDGNTTSNEIASSTEISVDCMKPENAGNRHCKWMKPLKYYVFSAHDSTMRSLLSALDANKQVVNNHNPRYSSAILFELWNTTEGLGLKVLYHRNYSEWELEEITSFLDGCSELVNGYCPFAKFRESAIVYYPGNSTALCYNTKDKKTSFYPGQPPKPKSANKIHFPIFLLSILTLICQLDQQ